MKLKNGKAPRPDRIPSELLKTFCDEIIAPLTIIYLDSLETGVFPAIWKKMFISPVKKPGKSKSKPESFRPVALTSIIGKVMEMIVTEEVQTFLEDNKLLANAQHGFRRGRSCISQLLKHSEMILKALEAKVNIDSVYLDFQKAFDKADLGLIGKRCKEKGITGKLGMWIQDFLYDRVQYVITNN